MKVLKEDSDLGKALNEVEKILSANGITIASNSDLYFTKGDKVFYIRDTEFGHDSNTFPRVHEGEKFVLNG